MYFRYHQTLKCPEGAFLEKSLDKVGDETERASNTKRRELIYMMLQNIRKIVIN
jgi:hypothetical protein